MLTAARELEEKFIQHIVSYGFAKQRQPLRLTMTGNEVGRVKAHFDDLDDKFSRRLAENVGAETTVEPDTLEDMGVFSVQLPEILDEPEELTVHQALLVSSCLNSRDRNTAMRILKMHR